MNSNDGNDEELAKSAYNQSSSKKRKLEGSIDDHVEDAETKRPAHEIEKADSASKAISNEPRGEYSDSTDTSIEVILVE